MCGIFGVATVAGSRPSIGVDEAARLRDLLAHRGPDGAGLWAHHNVILGHRRLAVVDPSAAGAQPMAWWSADAGTPGTVAPEETWPPGRRRDLVMVYNGELYNDAEVRCELAALGVRFTSSCDAETVLHAWATWGSAALQRLRGMFAVAIHDVRDQTLTLIRDPLGIKPLYYHVGGREVIFASEPGPITAYPGVGRRPDLAMVSAYLTTIRTVLGDRTLYEGVRAVRPGEIVRVDLGGERPVALRSVYWSGATVRGEGELTIGDVRTRVREAVEASIRRHLRSDVPVCALLSGGLDSTIVAAIAGREHPALRTYAAGAPLPCKCRDDVLEGDLAWARVVSRELGTHHAEALVERGLFAERWGWMVERMGMPLSTPNEVAIWAVASRLREDGCVVTLSGEGADELFAGYDGPMTAAAAFCGAAPGAGLREHALHELTANAWIGPAMKPSILRPEVWREVEADVLLVEEFERQFEASAQECGGDMLGAHLRLQRRINLTGLLQRLDSATMLAGVEGRTPLADREVAELAESLPMTMKFALDESDEGGGGAATLTATRARTKIVLREAFAGVVPAAVLTRPKASFPLPFREWMPDQSEALRRSDFVRSIFNDAIVDAVAREPERLWNLAWPMMNLALWQR